MRSTSATPPPPPRTSPAQPFQLGQDEDDDKNDFSVISVNIRIPNRQLGTPSTKPVATIATSPSPSNKRRASASRAQLRSSGGAGTPDETANESDKKRGKEHAVHKDEDDEGTDERLISRELKLGTAKGEEDRKGAGSTCPRKVSSV